MKWLKWAMAALILLAATATVLLSNINHYQTDGEVNFASLDSPVKVIRDEKGMAYIHADNLSDVLKAQGYVTAQDRLFQMLLTRTLVQGRLAEFFGEAALESDKLQRTLGFYRAASQHEAMLDEQTLAIFEAYTAGVNHYILEASHEHPVELGLAKLTPEPWTITDSLAIMYYMGWGSAANLKGEILAQKLIEHLGVEKFMSIYPIAINPGDSNIPELVSQSQKTQILDRSQEQHNFLTDPLLTQIAVASNHLATGSNNWAVDATLSARDKPIVVNDPHLSTKMLPTVFYTLGLFTPEMRVVGANVPGIPSLLVGRNEYVAMGVTNQYGDAQDLYIETVDPANPANYLEGDKSIPFDVIEESIRVKDDSQASGYREEQLTVRRTNRGPVVSNVQKGLETEKVMSVRWTPLETMRPAIGIDVLLKSKSIADIQQYLSDFTLVHLNFVFADINGGIGWQTTGKLPIRSKGDGTIPVQITDSQDNWATWIPYAQMPQSYKPAKGWVGTANNKTVTNEYPHYFSSWFAPNNRYQRMVELLDTPESKTAEDHWQFMRDDFNVTARDISPVLADALQVNNQTKPLGEILSRWDFRESTESVATAIYHETYRNLVHRVFKDELGEELGDLYIGSNYFWQERFGLMIKRGDSEWFDDVTTANKTETLPELIQQAGLDTISQLTVRIGNNPQEWLWGKIHQIEFLNPLRRKGVGKDWLGGGTHAMAGSGDTILRALYPLNSEDNIVQYSATLRMVADLSDHEKVMAISPGGISGRTFTPHFVDQIPAYMNGEKSYWWFSADKINEHAVSTLYLIPK